MKIGTVNLNGEPIGIFQIEYSDGNMAITLQDAENCPYMTLSVNLPDKIALLGENEFFAKTWSENEPYIAPILATGLFTNTGKSVPTGYVEAQVWKLNK